VSVKTDAVWKDSSGILVHQLFTQRNSKGQVIDPRPKRCTRRPVVHGHDLEIVLLSHDGYSVGEVVKITRKSVAPVGNSLARIHVYPLSFFKRLSNNSLSNSHSGGTFSVLASVMTSKSVTCLIPASIFDRVPRLIFHPSNSRRTANASCDNGGLNLPRAS